MARCRGIMIVAAAYPHQIFQWFSSVSPGECRVSTSTYLEIGHDCVRTSLPPTFRDRLIRNYVACAVEVLSLSNPRTKQSYQNVNWMELAHAHVHCRSCGFCYQNFSQSAHVSVLLI